MLKNVDPGCGPAASQLMYTFMSDLCLYQSQNVTHESIQGSLRPGLGLLPLTPHYLYRAYIILKLIPTTYAIPISMKAFLKALSWKAKKWMFCSFAASSYIQYTFFRTPLMKLPIYGGSNTGCIHIIGFVILYGYCTLYLSDCGEI